ncbi:Peptidyl-tRNA hydrolase [Candidatus Tiddalikarchaeum anstoanum]|nr:Peptidyl-tRNA hydrolase [Candidatus Tiddalikarchaeum anstoanum]
MEYKQAIIIRTDLDMKKGKMVAQGSHASVGSAYKVFQKNPVIFKSWFGAMTKIVLKVSSEKELIELAEKAGKEGLVHELVHDAGRTQVEPGSITALAIGPDEEKKIDIITSRLKLL